VRWRKAATATVESTGVVPLPIREGTRVFVRDQYLGNWCSGFEVAAVLDDGYRLRRLTDGRIFPDLFPFDDVHLERRRVPRNDDDSFIIGAERRHFP